MGGLFYHLVRDIDKPGNYLIVYTFNEIAVII